MGKPQIELLMLEIIAAIYLGKKIRDIVKEKGLNPTGYIIIMVVLWIGFEFFGALVGMLITEDEMGAYVFAIIGAVLGAAISYAIADNAKPAKVEKTLS